jgi:hypothetical protein
MPVTVTVSSWLVFLASAACWAWAHSGSAAGRRPAPQGAGAGHGKRATHGCAHGWRAWLSPGALTTSAPGASGQFSGSMPRWPIHRQPVSLGARRAPVNLGPGAAAGGLPGRATATRSSLRSPAPARMPMGLRAGALPPPHQVHHLRRRRGCAPIRPGLQAVGRS